MRTWLLVATLAAMASASSDGKRTVRWGIMGTGTIANDFVRVLVRSRRNQFLDIQLLI